MQIPWRLLNKRLYRSLTDCPKVHSKSSHFARAYIAVCDTTIGFGVSVSHQTAHIDFARHITIVGAGFHDDTIVRFTYDATCERAG